MLAVALALGSWTLFAGGKKAPAADDTGSRQSPAPGQSAHAGSPAFRYADTTDLVLFRVDHAPAVPAAAAPRSRAGTGVDAVPIRISRHTALASARRGTMEIALPDGTRYPVRYERSESAPGGNWTFIGRVDTVIGDLAAVITFGSDGVFGLLPKPDGKMLQITTRAGQAYLRPAAGVVPPGADPARHPDFLLPPSPAPQAVPGAQPGDPTSKAGSDSNGGSRASKAATIGQAADETDGEVTIDILATYTTNLIALRGSVNGVMAEFYNLVAIANQAHIDSGSRARLSIAGFAEIDYPATAGNEEVLYAITDNALPDATDIASLRDEYAADLVAVIRPYAEGDPTCGIAWLSTWDLRAFQAEEQYAYSVTAVEDCGPLVLAHELGHNLGLMHDHETVRQQAGGALEYGAFHYSFGYRQVGPPGFATVMAYQTADQLRVGRFSHPGTDLCEGVACGIEDVADNVRSLNQTADSIARFRDPQGTVSILDVHVLEGDQETQVVQFTVRASSPAPQGGVFFDIVVADGTATEGVDWNPAPWNPEQAVIPEGSSQTYFAIEVPPDVAVEGDETIELRLENVQGMAVFDGEAVGVIHDDDPRIPVRGRVRFPAGSDVPAASEVSVSATIRGADGVNRSESVQPQGPDMQYEFTVPVGGHVTLYVNAPSPFLHADVRLVAVDAPLDDVDLSVVKGVRFAGALLAPGEEWLYGIPVVLWNPYGDGSGYYVNYGVNGDFWGYNPDYEMDVLPDVPMQLEVSEPPAPYVRQLVEIPPLRGDGTWNIELRDVPSLTISHAIVSEGAHADGLQAVTMTAELSMPAPAGGVSFDLGVGGTVDPGDFLSPAGTYSIPEGATTVDIPLAIAGDDRGEPDETLELRISNIQGAAWNPGPGSVRIANDDPWAVASDFDGDDRSDILWRNLATGRTGIWLAGDYGSQRAIVDIDKLAWKMDAVGDFDGDGQSDIFWRNHDTGANVVWESGRYQAQRRLAAVTSQDWQVVATGDFNGDGDDDLFWRNGRTGSNAIWQSGSHERHFTVVRVRDVDWQVAGAGDFDGDGRADLLWRHARTGANVTWRGADHASGYPTRDVGNLDWELAGIGDIDADGNADLAWRNRATGDNVAWLAADSARQRNLGRVADQAWEIRAVGDYDGDGLADLLWRNRETGANVVWDRAERRSARYLTTITNLWWQVRP